MLRVPLRWAVSQMPRLSGSNLLRLGVLLCCFLCSSGVQGRNSYNPVPEQLTYEVVYHWGVIWKKAAEATLSLDISQVGDTAVYKGQLVARTLAFADKIFRVRDTLNVVMKGPDMRPYYYAKIADEDNTYRKDEVYYHYSDEGIQGITKLYRPKRNAIESYVLKAEKDAFDMMSVFYYIRTLDFENAQMYQRFPVKIFSGKKVENLSIEYLGRTIFNSPSKRVFNAFKIKLRFSIDNGASETENITAWISDDGRKIPLQVEGRLPLGALKALYTGE